MMPDAVSRIVFDMPGWTEQQPGSQMRLWRAPCGSVLSLAMLDSDIWSAISEKELQEIARRHAAGHQAGLIEVNRLQCGNESAFCFIYKRLQMPAYVFTGMFFVRLHGDPLVWTIVDGESGTTGVREAVVMAELVKATNPRSAGDLEKLWGEDPYNMTSLGVDSSVRRFTSDGEEYDGRFPDHPLTRVRQCLSELRAWIASYSNNLANTKTVN